MSILSVRKHVITTNSRSDHNDADLSSIFEVYIMFVNWFHNMFYYILDIYNVDVQIIKVVCQFELFDCLHYNLFFCVE